MADSNESFVFNWKIENFSMLPHLKGEKLMSPFFTVDSLAKTKWFVLLYPRGFSTNETEDYISCFIFRADYKSNPVKSITGSSFVLESINDLYNITLTSQKDDVYDRGAGYDEFCLRSHVMENSQYVLPQDVLTIRFHLWSSEQNIAVNDNLTDESKAYRQLCNAISGIKVQRRSFTWPIMKINQLNKSQKRTSIISETTLDKTPSLKLSLHFSDDTTKEYAQVEIRRMYSEKDESLFVKSKITVLSADKEFQVSHEASHLFSSSAEDVWQFPEFLQLKNLVDTKYITDDTLFLHFELAFSRPGTEYHLEAPSYVPNTFLTKPSSEVSHLADSIRHLYVSGKFCDVTVRVGEKRFPCHKVALCAQSPVFSAMFESDMQEKNTGVVEIQDLDTQAVVRMLTFMYSDVLEDTLSTEDTCKLYEAADKYQVLSLKRKCSLLFLSTLSVKSVCDVLAIADRCQDSFLLVNVHNFLTVHASETFHSPQWKIFMDDFPKLSGKIMFQIWMNKSL